MDCGVVEASCAAFTVQQARRCVTMGIRCHGRSCEVGGGDPEADTWECKVAASRAILPRRATLQLKLIQACVPAGKSSFASAPLSARWITFGPWTVKVQG